ncbi:aldo-keto reductase family 1 member C18-like [Saccopteryx bilineata]|uniref:aldo-keto reductase family 1 member C18-like n=1 Tax=Saccopteryx bilineata TaxID=59482 RepID=UPI00338D52D3
MSAMSCFSVKLNNRHFMPRLGFGTWAPSKVTISKEEEAIKSAIDVGYHHIDSAYVYLNEEEIGRAIQEKIANGSVKRDDIIYTSNVLYRGTFFRPKLVQTGMDLSLKKLQQSYVDLFLTHSLVALKPGEEIVPKDAHGKFIFDTVSFCTTWALQKCKEAGLAKSIGVSNFNIKQLVMILNKPGLKDKPVCNQCENKPSLNLNETCRMGTMKADLLERLVEYLVSALQRRLLCARLPVYPLKLLQHLQVTDLLQKRAAASHDIMNTRSVRLHLECPARMRAHVTRTFQGGLLEKCGLSGRHFLRSWVYCVLLKLYLMCNKSCQSACPLCREWNSGKSKAAVYPRISQHEIYVTTKLAAGEQQAAKGMLGMGVALPEVLGAHTPTGASAAGCEWLDTEVLD